MKALLSTLIIIALNCTFAVMSASGQVVAVGHASAEIIEAVSVSSQAVTGFEIDVKTSFTPETVNLGNIKISSGSSVACNLIVKTATLSNANGNSFTIEPSAKSTEQVNSQLTDGNQTINIVGKAQIAQGQASGLYQGSYTMVFAYN